MAASEPAGLYLIVEAMTGHAALERLKAALSAARIASVLIAGEKLDAASARPFVELIQSHDVAALIDGDAQLVRTLRADGVHLRASKTLEADVTEAREVLGTRYIVGAEAASRHDAMMLGEQGADYVAFPPGPAHGDPASLGGSDAPAEYDQAEFVSWWAEIFELPCVAFDVASLEEAAAMAKAGADFVAVRVPASGSPADIQEQVRAAAAALQAPQAATNGTPAII